LIYGDGIRLRAPEQSDLENFVRWLNDPEVIAGLQIYTPLSVQEEQAWFENMLMNHPAEHPMVIEVEQDGVWRPVGNCGVHRIDWRIRSAELGIFIGEKSFWNQGIGTQVMKLLLQHGFNTLNLNRIALDVYGSNPRAIRTYEKAGFVLEGCKRQAAYRNGKYSDVLIMSVLRSEWQEEN
jgi:RimJ/RimL family protein N-acetyltransferase